MTGQKRTVRVIKRVGAGCGLRMTVVRSPLYDAGVHSWTAEFRKRKSKKGRGKWTGFRYRFEWMGVRRTRVMEMVMGMGRVRGIIGTDRHDDLPLQALGRVSPWGEGGKVHRFSRPAERGGGNNIPFFEVVRDLAVVLGVVFCEEGGVQDLLKVHGSRLILIPVVVAEV